MGCFPIYCGCHHIYCGNHLFYPEITFFTEVNKAISKVNKVISEVKNCSIPIFTMNNPPFLLIYHFSGGVKMVNKEKWGVIYIANNVKTSPNHVRVRNVLI